MRSFIALNLEPAVKDPIQKIIQELKPLTTDIKWAKPHSLHLTLKFLGEISPSHLPRIKTAIKQVCSEFTPFLLQFTGMGTFPVESPKPRIIWAGIEASDSLNSPQHRLETCLEQLGFPAEKRKFSPHLTLGRVRSAAYLRPLLSQLQKHKDLFFGQMSVCQVILYKSTLKPSGAEYTPIFTMDLT